MTRPITQVFKPFLLPLLRHPHQIVQHLPLFADLGACQSFDLTEVALDLRQVHPALQIEISDDLRRAQCYRVLADIKVLQGCRGDAERLYSQAVGLARSVGSEREATRIRDAMELLATTA